MKKNIFPFTAIVAQEKIKKALILNAINPSIGGVLIRGDRGTGKTTAVRALADLLPEIEVIEDIPFNVDLNSYEEFELYKNYNQNKKDFNEDKSDNGVNNAIEDESSLVKVPMKVVELPLGATEDRVVGSIDIEKALTEGIKSLEPGILADANNGILYIDEINLLDDNLVDVLLDAAASGVNIVEREGISIAHPSKFILVGTMNPEEGDLRGQLSDRIGLKIDVEGISDIGDRILIMKRREDFEKNPSNFRKDFEDDQKALRDKIIQGRENLSKIKITDILMEVIARLNLDFGSEGHRNDISILKTSKTIAALNGHLNVEDKDLEEAISLVLGEDKLLSQRIQKIKQEIEKNKENEDNNKSLDSLQDQINQDKDLEDLNNQENQDNLSNQKDQENQEDREFLLEFENDEDKSRENKDEALNLEDSQIEKMDFVEDSDFKIEDDSESKVNEAEKFESYYESDDESRKFDIKNF